MRLRFIHKQYIHSKVKVATNSVVAENSAAKDSIDEPKSSPAPSKNKKSKKGNNMLTNEQIEKAEAIMDTMAPEVKVVKKDRGLIERTESSKIILTEDNRQVLND